MTDKERLENMNPIGFDLGGNVLLKSEDYHWLAELVGYFARKNGELNEFLNKYIEPKHLGKNVIDVAMDIIAKQSERVQELEQQNKRYREAMETVLKVSEYYNAFGGDLEIVRADMHNILDKALEGEK